MTIKHFKLTNKTDKYYYFNILVETKVGIFFNIKEASFNLFREIDGNKSRFINSGQPLYEIDLNIDKAINALLDSGIDEHNL